MARVQLSRGTVRAVEKYGPSVERLAERKYGIHGDQLLARLDAGESGGRMGAVSSANARGETQFIPSTRRAVMQKYGIDPWRSRDEAVHAAALHLLGKLGNAKGLEGYNPGSSSYPGYILGQRTNLGSASRKLGLSGRGSRGGARGGGNRAQGRGRVSTGAVSVQALSDLLGLSGSNSQIASLVSGRPQAPVSAPPSPAVDARSSLPMPMVNGQPVGTVESSGAPVPKPSVGDVLAAITSDGASGLAPVRIPGEKGRAPGGRGGGKVKMAPRARAAHGGLDFPLGRRGKIIGVPYQGTHTDFGNWQSDNAIDIAVPQGTPVVAVANGRIGSRIGPLDSGNPQLAGQRVYVEAPGNQWYYAHLSRIVVKPGQHVRKGQVIGYSGAANGVQHLHIAAEKGNPLKQFGGR